MIGLIDRIAMWYWRPTLRTPENERRVQEFREYLRKKALEESADGAVPEWDEENPLDLYATRAPGGRKSGSQVS
jgi:hypothetical protein